MESQAENVIQVLLGAGACAVVPLTLGLSAIPAPDRLGHAARAIALAWLVLAAIWVGFAIVGSNAVATSRPLRWPTPAHFLYAGFALTSVAVVVDAARATALSRLSLAGVLVGMPLLAVQIGFIPEIQWTGALVIGASGIGVALEQVRASADFNSPIATSLLRASSAALVTGMVLAVGYGVSTRFDIEWLSLEAMVITHGVFNSVGFTLLSLLGWRHARHHEARRLAAA